ncbi:DUF6290 family protein [Gemella morbillorum]
MLFFIAFSPTLCYNIIVRRDSMNNLFEVKTQKEKRITFRVTSDEFKVLKEKAEDKNLTVSDLIRTILAENINKVVE